MFMAVSKQNMGSFFSIAPALVLQQELLLRAAMRSSFSASVQANSCSHTCAPVPCQQTPQVYRLTGLPSKGCSVAALPLLIHA